MKIFLVRHGQSEANVDRSIGMTRGDHAISLTPRGVARADKAAQALLEWIIGRQGNGYTRIWTSPYKRARQTAAAFVARLDGSAFIRGADEVLEHIGLAEQQFGLFDGVPEEELPKRFPAEHAHYKKYEDDEGRFWARMPLGESRFDVSLRVHQSFGTFQRDHKKYKNDNLIIVAHGVTIRAFVMGWCHKTVEWFEKEPNPPNCSIRLIDDSGEDQGYIYSGDKEDQ